MGASPNARLLTVMRPGEILNVELCSMRAVQNPNTREFVQRSSKGRQPCCLPCFIGFVYVCLPCFKGFVGVLPQHVLYYSISAPKSKGNGCKYLSLQTAKAGRTAVAPLTVIKYRVVALSRLRVHSGDLIQKTASNEQSSVPNQNHSVLSAITGSFLAATLEGMIPAMTVSTTLMPTSISAAMWGI